MMGAVNARIKIYPAEGLIEFSWHSKRRQPRINACGFYASLISEYAMLFIGETNR
jgi:hypothetical protein